MNTIFWYIFSVRLALHGMKVCPHRKGCIQEDALCPDKQDFYDRFRTLDVDVLWCWCSRIIQMGSINLPIVIGRIRIV